MSSNATLPSGWKVISARQPNSNEFKKIFISPEGKKFMSLQAAKSWLVSSIEDCDTNIIESPRKVLRRKFRAQNETENEMSLLSNYRLVLPEKIQRRRKQMTDKNPFNNLLKTTLKKNHKQYLMKTKSKKRLIASLFGTKTKKRLLQAQRKSSLIVSKMQRQRREG